ELFAPLIVARKGLYTDLAEWARRKGYSHLRVDGKLMPTAHWPRLDRFKEHNIELPVRTLEEALEFGKGVVVAAVPAASGKRQPPGTAATTQLFSTRRACPKCSRSFPELDPRLFSYN